MLKSLNIIMAILVVILIVIASSVSPILYSPDYSSKYLPHTVDPDVTIVTAFYSLDLARRSLGKYQEYMQNFFTIRTNKIIFTNKHTLPLIKSCDTSHYRNITYVIVEIPDFYVSRKYPDAIWTKHLEVDPSRNIHSISLYKVWSEKINFVMKGVTLNPYNTNYFMWCDMGMFRRSSTMPRFKHWGQSLNIPDDQILLFLRDKFSESEKLNSHIIDDRFSNWTINRVMGGTISGTVDSIKKFHYLYYDMLDQFVKKGIFIGREEGIFSFIVIQNPTMFQTKVTQYLTITKLMPLSIRAYSPWRYPILYLNTARKLS